ncbi:transcriptional regulator [Pleomorphomonas koreensis]|uniref:transcriptional regulator n=1 Tax=Pleomorphomonas koreensis TaxID=257440 RepID=UPI00040B63DF|nr:transcriptional regulator [Pleomorphomonas koreensis]
MQEVRAKSILPLSLPPRGLSRLEAAAYIGISPTKFDELVSDRRMPTPKKIDGRYVWDIRRLDAAFDRLPDRDGGDNPEDRWGDLAV